MTTIPGERAVLGIQGLISDFIEGSNDEFWNDPEAVLYFGSVSTDSRRFIDEEMLRDSEHFFHFIGDDVLQTYLLGNDLTMLAWVDHESIVFGAFDRLTQLGAYIPINWHDSKATGDVEYIGLSPTKLSRNRLESLLKDCRNFYTTHDT
jgi:hypothetical protein